MKSLKEYTNNLINERRELINKKTTSEELKFIKEAENKIKDKIVGHSYCFLTENFNDELKELKEYFSDSEYMHFIGLEGVLLEYTVNKFIIENKSNFENKIKGFYQDYENADIQTDKINFEVKSIIQEIGENKFNGKEVITFKKSIKITPKQNKDIKVTPFIIIRYNKEGCYIKPYEVYVRFPWQVYIGTRNEDGKSTFHITAIDKFDFNNIENKESE